ncbi:Holliday junction resolvase RecU [Thalassobacillus sp. CUG 92003]|uniref:Holliday junction resolvase RecU n=1 Tax=Thalassobacillus sp. CUG 92003 TaxID=2736641 RepID=UPI003519F1D6
MNYPNGKRARSSQPKASRTEKHFGNRGMSLEEDINHTNAYYQSAGIAVIHKKPTPVQIVNVDYPKRSAAVIKEAYFKQPSTTDYNGIYRSHYIDFEAKETRNKTSFPFSNIHQHQIDHMKAVVEHGGLCFFIIKFTPLDETFLLPAVKLFSFWDEQYKGGRKSIPYDYVKNNGELIPFHYQARINYIKILDKLYF